MLIYNKTDVVKRLQDRYVIRAVDGLATIRRKPFVMRLARRLNVSGDLVIHAIA